jgi:DNA ligase-1
MYASPTLYKTGSNGSELQWSISTEPYRDGNEEDPIHEDQPWVVITRHGQVGGAIQESSFVVTKGKNIGRANETTPEQQADSEAQSKYNKQLDKRYSTERGGASKEYQPMLAQSYDKHKGKVKFPCYAQPKLDGMRCIAICESDTVTLMSRGGKEITTMKHIKEELLKFMEDGEVWDGELYSHELNFQQAVSLIKREQPDSIKIKYNVYDVVADGSFKARFLDNGIENIDKCKHICMVTTGICKSHNEVIAFHNDFVRMGYEGAILRHSECLYKEGARSYDLLKVKQFFDGEFEIVDVVPSDRSPTHGNFVCLMTGTTTTFTATPEGTHETKEQYLRDRESLIGKFLTVRYFEMTTSDVPVPRFPIGVGIRDYE